MPQNFEVFFWGFKLPIDPQTAFFKLENSCPVLLSLLFYGFTILCFLPKGNSWVLVIVQIEYRETEEEVSEAKVLRADFRLSPFPVLLLHFKLLASLHQACPAQLLRCAFLCFTCLINTCLSLREKKREIIIEIHCVSLWYMMCWFDTFIHRNMITTISLANMSTKPHNYHFFFCVWWEVQDLVC